MLEKNTRTTLLLHQRPSCLVLFDSGASLFPCLKHTISFLSSILLLAFPLALPSISRPDSGVSSQHEAVPPESKKQRYKRWKVSGMHTPFGSALG